MYSQYFKLFAVFILLMKLETCWGNTSLNNEQREFLMVQSAILQFQNNTQKFPTSWDDLWDNVASRPSVEWLDQGKSFGRRTDMMESFRFIASGTTIRLPNDGSIIIGMMTRPMRPPPDTKRRFLIVKFKDGTRGIEQLSEEVLRKIFSDMGLNLNQYTGPNGNWAPETRLRPPVEVQPRPKNSVPDLTLKDSTDSSSFKTINSSNPINPAHSDKKKPAVFQWWFIVGPISLLVITLTVFHKIRNSKISF